MYKHIIFDLDGTLVYSHKGIHNSIAYALSCIGVDIPSNEVLMKFIGPPLEYSYMNFCGLTEKQCDKAVALFRERYSEKGIYECELIPGTLKMLENLNKEGFKLYIATSKPLEFATAILKELKIYDFFQSVGAAPLCSKKRDKTTIIKTVLQEFEINTHDLIIMVGDRKEDVMGSMAAGVKFVGVNYGYAEENELKVNGAKTILNTVLELEKYLIHS